MATSERPSILSPPWFRRIMLRSVQAGLAPLIPIPFIDDWVIRKVRKWMVRELCTAHGVIPEKRQIKLILDSGDRSAFLWGCLVTVFLYPIKVFLRKVFFVLSLKWCVDRASEVFHEGYLIEHALATGALDARALSPGGEPAIQRVCIAIRETSAELDPGPIKQLLKRTFAASKETLLKAARFVGRAFRRIRRSPKIGSPDTATDAAVAAEQEEERILGGILDQLTEAIWYRQDYLEDLKRKLDARLQSSDPPKPDTSIIHSC